VLVQLVLFVDVFFYIATACEFDKGVTDRHIVSSAYDDYGRGTLEYR
jgi:hypothetical protein